MKDLLKKNLTKKIAIFLVYVFGFIPQGSMAAETTCSEGVSVPPFLEAGVDSNLLLIIDNSASMYDLAYVDEAPVEAGGGTYLEKAPECYDETYNLVIDPNILTNPTPYTMVGSARIYKEVNTTYGGYFDPNFWYYWDFSNGRFSLTDKVSAQANCSNATGTKYTKINSSDSTFELCITVDETPVAPAPNVLNAFAARGNFLNWAMSSKFDIEKEILTGGKYDATDDLMILESRGCMERRFLKKVKVDQGGTDYYLTLGVRPPEDTEKASATDLTTRLDIFDLTTKGYDNAACQKASELFADAGSFGTIKGDIADCIGYTNKDKELADKQNAYSHALHDCWYYNKHTVWPPGAGSVMRIKNDCSTIYNGGVSPETITTDDRAYVCSANWFPAARPAGQDPMYVGDCWVDNPFPVPDGFPLGADADGGCIDVALQEYCKITQMPEVIDPTDEADETGTTWNLPAILIDSGVLGQLGEPISVLKGQIFKTTEPTGIVQDYGTKLRMGVMAFNHDGAAQECADKKTDDYLQYSCDGTNQDGAEVLAYIDKSTTHTASLVSAINGIVADSWTPLAEAMYNAIGYYTQMDFDNDTNPDMRLNTDDYSIGVALDPITAHCQKNHILIVTDGSSSADINDAVETFALSNNDSDGGDIPECGKLYGSTWLDDLTYYAATGTDIFDPDTEIWGADKKQNITTHIVVAGTIRDNGDADECNPLELMTSAAKDANGDPTLYESTDTSQLEANLKAVFAAVSAGATSGSAASVISSARGGEGAVYQAIFWKDYNNPDSVVPAVPDVNWVGEVHALLVDEFGYMYEDTPQGSPTPARNYRLDGGDQQIFMYYDELLGYTRVCDDVVVSGVCIGASREMSQVHYLWSATEWLSSITDGDIIQNRALADYISNVKKRYIFTWNDLDNDGIVDKTAGADNEVLPFEASHVTASNDWEGFDVTAALPVRGDVVKDFGESIATNAQVDEIVNWIRGLDQADMRSREAFMDMDRDGDLADETSQTWRLGDVIHSTPMVVARPAEGYHVLYRDASYGDFVQRWDRRRQMVYFGANDGMLHAVTAGFYDETNVGFFRSPEGTDEANHPELGAEMWAYVPYNLIPHLKCLKETTYGDKHKYFVDGRPRIFDVKIFDEEAACSTDTQDQNCKHPHGWGTILVGGMRFGGSKVAASDLNYNTSDTRVFTSSYFILDITDPENPPTLLGEFTNVGSEMDLGYTTAIPTIVPMKNSTTNEWYLILGSGPSDVDGSASQTPKIGVYPLNNLITNKKPLRIDTTIPDATDQIGSFELDSAGPNGFVSDLVTVDYDLDKDYMADAVYFGTIEENVGTWGGKLYRLVTHEQDTKVQHPTLPSDWADLLDNSRSNSDWALTAPGNLPNPQVFIDVNQPITAAPNVATDGNNFFIYFGTGRFFNKDDKTNTDVQSYYGIKEPVGCVASEYTDEFTWEEVEKTGTHGSAGGVPGGQGLLNVTKIHVNESTSGETAGIFCDGGGTVCLPNDPSTAAPLANFGQLVDYIVGTNSCGGSSADNSGTDGWYRDFERVRERNLGQATLLGGLVTYTTYQPYDDACLNEGIGYLYAVYYQTGTAFYRPVFGYDSDNSIIEQYKLGRGLSPTPNLHVGKDGVTAILQTSTGEIVGVEQQEQAIKNIKTGKTSWREITP